MKMVEALISLVVLLSFTSLSILHAPHHPSQLQKYQLAEDVWRVAYLKGCFNQSLDYPVGAENQVENCLNPVLREIEQETGLPIAFYSPIEAAAGPGLPGENSILLKKTIILDGAPRIVEVRVG